jgi:hypothetical protein
MIAHKKYCYWVDHHEFKRVRESLEKRGTPLIQETRIPCRVLRPSIEIGFVAPPAWEGFCRRRTSWYWRSEKAEKFLIVSHTPLDLTHFADQSNVSESNFKPDPLPDPEEIVPLIQSEEYQKEKPSLWDEPDPVEKDMYQRWFEHHRITEPFDFERILMIHSANHANFLQPKFFVTASGTKAPYSISDSLHVCSSCLEFFDILGNQWSIKYVVPCIGAVQFAHLPMNQYFKVESHQKRD